MEFIEKKIDEYSSFHTTEESPILKKINRETWSQVMMPRMLSGHMQGRFLSMISKMVRPRMILEIGTYTGYSAICLAEGLEKDGRLITIDINEELERRVRGYFQESGFSRQIDYRIGNAMELIPTIEGSFDLVFIDADKINYLNYYNLLVPRLKSGAIIIADNVLWSGKVTELQDKMDKDTRAIHEFNHAILHDSRVENILVPIRDGLMIARVK